MHSAEVKNCASIIAIQQKQLLSHFVACLSTRFLTYSFQASLMRLLKKRIMQSAEVKSCGSIIAIYKKATRVSFCGPLLPFNSSFFDISFSTFEVTNSIVLRLRQPHVVAILSFQEEDRGKIFFFARLAQKGEILSKIEKFLQ